MESRLIFESNKTYLTKVSWLRKSGQPESEWTHYGKGGEVKIELVDNALKNHMKSNILHISTSRIESLTVNKEDFFLVTAELLGSHNFEVWDYDFKNVMQFNNIGIFRIGTVI